MQIPKLGVRQQLSLFKTWLSLLIAVLFLDGKTIKEKMENYETTRAHLITNIRMIRAISVTKNWRFYLAFLAAAFLGQFVFVVLAGMIPALGGLNPFLAFAVSGFFSFAILLWILMRYKKANIQG